MTIPTRPAPPPPQPSQSSRQNADINTVNQNQVRGKITITLPPPPSAKNKTKNTFQNQFHEVSSLATYQHSTSTTLPNNSITRHFPPAKTRYTPTTNWTGNTFETQTDINNSNNTTIKKAPPPRPPPPRVIPSPAENDSPTNSGGIFKNSRPQSVSVLTSLFGRRKSPATVSGGKNQKLFQPKIPSLLNVQSNINSSNNSFSGGSMNSFVFDWPSERQQTYLSTSRDSPHLSETTDVQLISFDSPPHSPTFTQKSNSDCVSVDSFSSDSNFSSPHNGAISQPESGFEDDFLATNITTTSATTTPIDPWDILSEQSGKFSTTTSLNMSGQLNYMHLNDMKNIDSHPIRNLHLLQKKENHLNEKVWSMQQQQQQHQQYQHQVKPITMPTIIRPKIQKGLAPKPPISQKPSIKFNENSFGSIKSFESVKNSEDIDDLPMPTCPPPPPPPEVDLHTTSVSSAIFVNLYDDFINEDNSNEPSYGIALYNFDGVEDGDLSLKENEKVYLLSRLNDEWYMGKNKKGCEGIFPSSYIDVKIPLKDQYIEGAIKKTNIPNASANSFYVKSVDVKDEKENLVKVLYTFEASHPEDLTILENQIVKVLYRINEDWLYGEIDNKQGQFPANFVDRIPKNLEIKTP